MLPRLYFPKSEQSGLEQQEYAVNSFKGHIPMIENSEGFYHESVILSTKLLHYPKAEAAAKITSLPDQIISLDEGEFLAEISARPRGISSA